MNDMTVVSSVAVTQDHIDLISDLWCWMASSFGHRWVSSYGETDEDGIWAIGLVGLSRDDLLRGVKKCVDQHLEWPPSMPVFHGMCLPTEEELGLPNIEQAYRAAVRLDWSLHPAVYTAAKIVGTHKLRYEAESSTRPRFESAWALVVKRIRNGDVLEKPIDVPRLERCEKTRKETGRAYVARIQTILRDGEDK